MKVIGINGSPRKQWNTATLVNKALEGAASAGAEVEMINLYTQTFRGCVSCFACKRKGSKTHGLCAVRDELTPILKKALEADAIVIGSPVYFSYPTAYTRAFIERFLFPLDSYMYEDGVRQRILDRVMPAGIIFTMNCPEEWLDKYHYPTILDSNREELEYWDMLRSISPATLLSLPITPRLICRYSMKRRNARIGISNSR